MRMSGLILAALLFAVPLRAQDTTQALARRAQRRDPKVAAVLGTIVPGAGHVYSTEYLRGLGIFAGAGSLIGWGTLAYEIDRCTFAFLNDAPCDPGPQWPHRTVGALLIAGGIGAWVVSAIDAPRAARRANARHGFRTAQWTPLIEPRRDSESGVNVGLAMRW